MTASDDEAADVALANALWCAENVAFTSGHPVQPHEQYVTAYVIRARDVRLWLRRNGYDVTGLSGELYKDH